MSKIETPGHRCNIWCVPGAHRSVIYTPPREDPRSWWNLPLPAWMDGPRGSRICVRAVEPAPEAPPDDRWPGYDAVMVTMGWKGEPMEPITVTKVMP